MKQIKKLVILGGGFAGVYTYLSIPKKVRDGLDITIIDKHNHFLFTPLIHEVATGALASGSVTEPIRKLIDIRNTKFLQTTVVSVDTARQIIETEANSVYYDYLVVSLGAETNFFNIPGAKEHSITLKTLEDAIHLRSSLIKTFEQASLVQDVAVKNKLLSFVIVGGGPTGVELAAECAELFFDTFAQYYQAVCCAEQVKIYLLNSNAELLQAFTKKFRQRAEKVLVAKNIIVKNGVKVVEVKSDRVVTDTGENILASHIIWVAGVAPSPISFIPEVNKTERGRIKVNDLFQVEGLDNVFVLGDIASFSDASGELPMLAQVATRQGTVLGKNLGRIIRGLKPKPFKYISRGSLVSLGQWQAVAGVLGVYVTGALAWFMWRTIYLFNFASWSKRFKIMLEWTINLFYPRDISEV